MLLVDDQGCYVEANSAACKLLSCVREQVLGRTLTDFCIMPPQVDLQQQWQVFLVQGHIDGTVTLRADQDEGRRVDYVTTANFCPPFHLSILRDVTDRRSLAALGVDSSPPLAQPIDHDLQLRQAIEPQAETPTALLENILGTIEGVVWSVDLQTMGVKYVNAAVETLCGYAAEEFLKVPDLWWGLIYPPDQAKVKQCLSQIDSQVHFELDYRITRLDGELRWVRDRSRVVYDHRRLPLRLNTVTTDIT
ncbi:MAG: PAS domain-containing protein, partial [Nodosilinea sp.]